MEHVYRTYPEDREAAAFYALAVNQTALPSDKTYAQQLKAAAILEKLWAAQPDHPGLPHYLIHAYDHPPLAPRALAAARSYAKIAPSAPHALHMPAHTFTRVGYWQESIDTNIASAQAAIRDGTFGEALHAMDYQVYAYLQTGAGRRRPAHGRRGAARARASGPNAMGGAAPGVAGLYAAAAIPARYALERGAWSDAAALQPQATAFPYVDALTRFARAIGAARSGKPDAARPDVAELGVLGDKLVAAKDAYLVGEGPHPATDRVRVGDIRGGTEGRGLGAAAQGGRRGRRHRQERDLSGPARARSRAAGRDAAGRRSARRRVEGIRGDDEEGAEPVPRDLRAPRRPPRSPATAPRRDGITNSSSRSARRATRPDARSSRRRERARPDNPPSLVAAGARATSFGAAGGATSAAARKPSARSARTIGLIGISRVSRRHPPR